MLKDKVKLMKNTDASHLNVTPGWKLLTEFLLPDKTRNEAQVIEQIGSSLKKLGLEPSQIKRIQTLIDQTLLDLDDVDTPVHIKISVSGVDLKKYVAVNPESAEELQSSKSGLGFFLVKRFVQQLQRSTESGYRMVEVLIYRE